MYRLIQRLLPISLLVMASCVTVGDAPKREKANLGPWIEASPQLSEQISENVERLPWTQGIERIEMIQWFAEVGEPGYAALLDMVTDERTDVAGAALAALGATRDARLVEPLRELPWPGKENTDLALERARTLLRLGDWSMVGQLIHGLRDKRVMIRALCAQALTESTHETFDFDANGTDEERQESIDRWNEWWTSRGSDSMR